MTTTASESLAMDLRHLRGVINHLHATSLMLSPEDRTALEAELVALRAVAAKLYAALDRGGVANG